MVSLKTFAFLELLLTYFLDCLLQCFNKLGVRDSHLRLINDELVLDEVLKSNEATKASEAGGDVANSAGETALAEITPPEQFQNFYAFPPEQQPQSSGSSNKKPFSRSASVGNQVKYFSNWDRIFF